MLKGFMIRVFGGFPPSVMVARSLLATALFCIPAIAITLPPASALANEVSKTDASNAKKVINFLDRRNWRDAKINMGKIKDPLLKDLLTWQYLTSHGTPGKFDEAVDFLSRRGDWPKRNRIIARAEETMPASMAPENVIASIGAIGGPVSAMGHARYGDALIKSGHKEAGILSLRAIWVNGNFTRSQEK
ncbi:MAG: hypothetical protein OEL50_05500, partial [Rhodospirillaceae bacterium]|nr:hypothetical protein [Rhodospirillaceae bacterium]